MECEILHVFLNMVSPHFVKFIKIGPILLVTQKLTL